MSFKINGHTVRVQHCFQCIRNLLTDPLLHGEAFGEDPNQAGQFGNADDVLMGYVSYIGLPEERQGMVFAKRKKWDWPFNNLTQAAVRLAVALCVKDPQ